MGEARSIRNVYAVILAGGSGRRMNTPTPKQFMMLGGAPVWIHSARKLLGNARVSQLWIGANGDWFDLARQQAEEYMGSGRVMLCEGGADREETLLNTLNAICGHNNVGPDDIVLIHDSVRPFLTGRIIDDVIREMAFCDACNTVVPVNDTVVQSADGKTICGMPVRSELFAGQSPQGFRLQTLLEAFRGLSPAERKQLTETTKVCFMKEISIHIVRGEFFNFKITTPYDWRVAETMLDLLGQ
ncbi:MAG: 2-C-methyl-D-erythritol 4-phosphate cytidylyltransferase [Oscillospiraceae bacterium]|jgi:2-C-methyl-D-erythritol 4-phosphate cytidylyltransferase|nr:2-C-methyl-D-erythritol 4-phosphate cytidylyltransferase [Oscillospiraceae bacterium]